MPHFADNEAFIAALCRYADQLIDRAIMAQPMAAPSAQTALASRLNAAREQWAQGQDAALAAAWRQLEQDMLATLEQGVFIPWINLVRLCQLDALEQQLLLIAMLPDFDAAYRAPLLEASGGESVADACLPLSAIAHLLAGMREAVQATLLSDGALLHWRILEIEPQGDVLRLCGGFRVDPAVAAYLCGRATPQLRLADVLPDIAPDGELANLPIDANTRRALQNFLLRCGADAPADASYVLQLQGPDPRMLERVCAALFGALGMSCARLDSRQWAGNDHAAMLRRLRLLCRDALLCNRVLVLADCRRLSGDGVTDDAPGLLENVLDTLLESQRYVVTFNGPWHRLAEHAHRYARHTAMPLLIQLPSPDVALRTQIWRDGAQRHTLPLSDGLLDQLVNSYLFTASQIDAVLKDTESRRLLDDGTPIEDLLLEACRAASVSEQFSIAQEVKTRYRMSDIVLPDATRSWLEDVLHYARQRHRVIEQWGFERHNPNSRNLCVLFHGLTGTGKTMAASIIANELNLGLYRVDLANVLSKYIGETEKHLAQLFDKAETMNVVLYFDEAESLFSKRTETRDAHDRYANVQTGYLLQRIETYPGIVVLSTNLLKNIDNAFTRRFKFIIEYPFPGAEQRRELWRKAFPADTPLAGDIDMDLLAAKAALSGGHINNIALRAAFYAAAENEAVGMGHVMKAVEREYDKLGKVFVRGEFAWGEGD
ncbi:ATP-binding protein [Dyella sp. M7H15-1]|uniref:ATP-binding protein n=1 Tax=Dyella sp. M7H15-1 TaxID=2501295 RepID=UPI0010050ED1|nr:ATP-binding protein [Dyella sp. M7H15-1]QAU25007.1 ATP-binding protein [Dyella sp. M7H15-1]